MNLKLEDSALKELARCNPKGYLELLGVFNYLNINPSDLKSLQTEFLDYKSNVSKLDSVIDLKFALVNVENQSTNIRTIDMRRFLKYGSELSFEHDTDVLTVITCSDIPKNKITELKILNNIHFTPLIVFFKEMDGKKILNNIIAKVENERVLNDLERAQLSIISLFYIEKHEFIETMVKAVDIVGKLKNPKEQIEEIRSVQFKLLNKPTIQKEAQEIFKMTELEWANPEIIDMFTKQRVEEAKRINTKEVTELVTKEVTEQVTEEVTESVTERIAREMLNNKLSIDTIAKITGLSVNRVKSL